MRNEVEITAISYCEIMHLIIVYVVSGSNPTESSGVVFELDPHWPKEAEQIDKYRVSLDSVLARPTRGVAPESQ